MLDFHYDEQRDILTVEGINYSGEMFREFGIHGLELGTAFQLIERHDGAIILERLGSVH